MRRARKILRALRIYLLAKMWLIRPYMRGNLILIVLFALAALYAFRQKILYLTVYRAEVIFRPGGNFGIELV